MARPTQLIAPSGPPAIVRMASPEADELLRLVLSRYPAEEWACFCRFGWRETASGVVLTLAAVDGPNEGELDASVGNVAFSEPYSLRMALTAEKHTLAVGVVHSHPEGCAPRPSTIDDDMDTYYARYFGDFAPGRPYVSLIVSRLSGELAISGRIYWQQRWSTVGRVVVERTPLRDEKEFYKKRVPAKSERHARLTGAFGQEAYERLRSSSVAVIGAGGTGSAAIEVLVRAGVGRLIVVDPDRLDFSNLERVHGSTPDAAAQRVLKVALARAHAHSIDPKCEVIGIVGSLPQREVVDALLSADVLLGCTDSQHSRLALSDLALRYLIPAIDCGVAMEGGNGRVSGQIVQLTRFLASDPCALCRGMIVPARLTQELMTEDERARRRAAAKQAEADGADPNAYWHAEPQLNTVGYLTTTAGAIAAGYGIGWLTGRYDMPFVRLQMNLVAPLLETSDYDAQARTDCVCRQIRGWSDQAAADALIIAPGHWPKPEMIGGHLPRPAVPSAE